MPASIYSVTLPFTYHQTETIQQPVLKEVVLNLTLCLPSAHPCSIFILNPQPLSSGLNSHGCFGQHMVSLQRSRG